MKSTYQMMNALVTLPPVGVSIKDDEGNTRKSASELRARICAVVPGWDKLNVPYMLPAPIVLREFSRGGYSDKSWVAGEEIMVPDGYLIIAMLVDEKGKPLNDELLPVELEELPNNNWVMSKPGPFQVSSGEVFISVPMLQQPVADSSHTISINIEGILKNVRENTARVAGEQAEAMSDLRKLIDKSIEESIRLNCRPGGLIWRQCSR